MLYEYKCWRCDESFDISKPSSEVDREEICPICHIVMKRIDVHNKVFVNLGTFEPHFNPAFGKKIHNKHQLREEIAQLNDEKGYDLQEVGNEKPQKRKRESKMREDTLRKMNQEVKRIRGY